jgi:hypothetical protein
MPERRRVVVDELLELGVQKIRSKFVLLHFRECARGVPAVVRHAIDGRHDAGPMASSDAVDVDGLIDRIGYDLHEFREL